METILRPRIHGRPWRLGRSGAHAGSMTGDDGNLAVAALYALWNASCDRSPFWSNQWTGVRALGTLAALKLSFCLSTLLFLFCGLFELGQDAHVASGVPVTCYLLPDGVRVATCKRGRGWDLRMMFSSHRSRGLAGSRASAAVPCHCALPPSPSAAVTSSKVQGPTLSNLRVI